MSKIDITQAAWVPTIFLIPIIIFYLLEKKSIPSAINYKDKSITRETKIRKLQNFWKNVFIIWLAIYISVIVIALEYKYEWFFKEDDTKSYNLKRTLNAVIVLFILYLPLQTILMSLVNKNGFSEWKEYLSYAMISLIFIVFIFFIGFFMDYTINDPFPLRSSLITTEEPPKDREYFGVKKEIKEILCGVFGGILLILTGLDYYKII